MTVMTFEAPPGFTPAEELPSEQIPDTPAWSENFCYSAYDADAEIGVWLHLGRTLLDPTLWRELSIVYLPGGDRLLTKGYGRTQSETGPGGATLRFDMVEPWNLWRTTLDGAAVRANVSELAQRAFPDAEHEPAGFALDWRSAAPTFEMGGDMQEQSWGDVHYHQVCNVSGTVRHSGEELAFDGQGIRDHTRGPRDYSQVTAHMWLHCVFASGRSFSLIDVDVGAHRLYRASVTVDGVTGEAEVVDPPTLTGPGQGDDGYVLQIGGHTITAEILHNMPMGFAGKNDVVLGYEKDRCSHLLYEGMTKFTWDGEVGHGLTERSVRH